MDFNNLSILIVDDEEGIRHGLKNWFKKRFNVFDTGDYLEAVAIAAKWQIDVAVLDIRLKGTKSGIDLFHQLTGNYPEMILILVTGYGNVEDAVSLMKEGAKDYLIKPIDHDRLLGTIIKCLEIKSLQEENKSLKNELIKRDFPHGFVAHGSMMKLIRDKADKIKNKLIEHFTAIYNQRYRKNVATYSPDAKNLLISCSWPGNIRQLKNVVNEVVLLSESSEIKAEDLEFSSLFGQVKNLVRPDYSKFTSLQEMVDTISIEYEKRAMFPDIPAISQRFKAFLKSLEEFPNITIIGIDVAGIDFSNSDKGVVGSSQELERNAHKQSLEIIQKHPDINAIFCTNDLSGKGIVKTILVTGLEGSVKIGVWDATAEMVSAINSGIVDLALAQNPEAMGAAAVFWGNRYLQTGESIPAKLTIDFQLLTKSNTSKPELRQLVYQ